MKLPDPVWQFLTRYTRHERMGLAALCLLLLSLSILRLGMSHWHQPEFTDQRQAREAWARFMASQPAGEDAPSGPAASAVLFAFDPNTLDSLGFIRLGLKPRTTRMLLNWRRKGKVFYRPEDLKPLYTLSGAEYERLAPYISIAPQQRPAYQRSSYPAYTGYYEKREAVPLNLNRADSASLERLYGIGPTLARRIVVRRNALGGYLHISQLLEVHRFPDSTFKMLESRLIINPDEVERMGLNSATLERMAAHPYVGEAVARNIILYRQGLGRYQDVGQLRQVPMMNEEKYRKIAPYFTVD